MVGWAMPAARNSQHLWVVLELQLLMGRPTLQAGGSPPAEMETERARAAYPHPARFAFGDLVSLLWLMLKPNNEELRQEQRGDP